MLQTTILLPDRIIRSSESVFIRHHVLPLDLGQTPVITKKRVCILQTLFLWSQLGLNQRPPDYESGATNQLSYRTVSPIL